MKNNKRIIYPFIFSIFVTIVFCIPYYQSTFVKGHDLFFHFSRIDGLKDAYFDYQILPKIYPYKNYFFGYASPLFYCDLFMYLPSLIYMLGLSLADTYILIVFTCTIFTFLTMFYCSKGILKRDNISYICSILYIFSYYRVIDVFNRAALGEVFAMIFIPLVILSIFKVFVLEEDAYLLLGISYAGLLFSHNISFTLYVLIFGLFIFIYIYKIFKNRKIFLTIVKGVTLALGLTGMFLFPMLEQLFTNVFKVSNITEYTSMSASAIKLDMILNCSYFNYAIVMDDFESKIALLNIFFIICIPVIFLFCRKRMCYFFKIITIICFVSAILSLDIIPWDYINIFDFMQFPWRFLIVCTPFITLLISFCLMNINRIVFKFLILFILFLSISNQFKQIINIDCIRVPHDIKYGDMIHSDKYGKPVMDCFDFSHVEVGMGEYIPSSSLKIKEHSLNITYNDLTDAYSDFYRDGTTMVFELNEKEKNVDILFPISWYKGYQVYRIDENNNKLENMHAVKDENYALVKFNTGQYTTGKFMMVYENTLVQNISYLISLFTFIWLINKLKIICLKKSSQFK